uniref:Uncharacterized protein n=1 Tax=Anopheles dirus TaxID=7168 RepID=A0A182NYK2_9DIPT
RAHSRLALAYRAKLLSRWISRLWLLRFSRALLTHLRLAPPHHTPGFPPLNGVFSSCLSADSITAALHRR